MTKLELPPFLVHRAVAAALEEDLGQAGDITTDPIIPADATAEAEIVARKPGVIAGQDLAAASFKALDPDAEFVADVADGGKVGAATRIAHVKGKARALLTAERTALNFLGHLSGIATLTAAYVAAVEGTKSAHRLHPQDDAWPARLREICGARRRRRQPPLRPL